MGRQAKYYNRSSRDLKQLLPGDVVWVEPAPGHKVWKKGVIMEEISDRKYRVDVQGYDYVSNRRYLRSSRERQAEVSDDIEIPMEEVPENPPQQVVEQNGAIEQKTRSGRVIRKPSRYKDYAM